MDDPPGAGANQVPPGLRCHHLHQLVDEPPLGDDDRLRPCQLPDLRRRVETLAAEFREVALHAAWDQGLDARRGIETDLWQKIQALEDAMSSDQALEEGAEGRRFRADLLQRVKVLDSCLGSLCCHYMQMRG